MNNEPKTYDAIVVGSGIFGGCRLFERNFHPKKTDQESFVISVIITFAMSFKNRNAQLGEMEEYISYLLSRNQNILHKDEPLPDLCIMVVYKPIFTTG